MNMTNHPCRGHVTGGCGCPAHTWRQCGTPGPEFGPPNADGVRDYARCGKRGGHSGEHAGFGYSIRKVVTW